MKKIIVDVKTNEVIIEDFLPEEIEIANKDFELAAKAAEENQKVLLVEKEKWFNERKLILDKLGLSAEEAKLLLS